MIGESVKSVARQFLPPIFLRAAKAIVKPFRKSQKLQFREHLNFVVHPDSRVPMEMFCYRSPEMVEEMDAFLALTKGKNRLLDVGAYHGVFSRNDLTANIVMQKLALSDASGSFQMYYEWDHAVAAPLGELGRIISTEKILGDVLCKKLAFEPDVIKIDVEGHELKVLNGLAQTIERAKPLLFIEVHPEHMRRENDTISDLSAFLENAGYQGKKPTGEPIELRAVSDLHTVARMIFEPGPFYHTN